MLKEPEAGVATADFCRKHGIASATFHMFEARYGGMDVLEARRLKILEDENAPQHAACRPDARQRDSEGGRRKTMLDARCEAKGGGS